GGVPLEEIPSEPPAEPLGAVDRDGWRRYTPKSGRLATRVVPQRCAPLSLERQGSFFMRSNPTAPVPGYVRRKSYRNRHCPNTSPSRFARHLPSRGGYSKKTILFGGNYGIQADLKYV